MTSVCGWGSRVNERELSRFVSCDVGRYCIYLVMHLGSAVDRESLSWNLWGILTIMSYLVDPRKVCPLEYYWGYWCHGT